MICSDTCIWHKYLDISKLLHVISRAVRRVKFETILKYYKRYLCQISCTNHAIICYTTTYERFVIFTWRYFKLSWNTTALSQSNCRNFSGSIIMIPKRWLLTLIFACLCFTKSLLIKNNNIVLLMEDREWEQQWRIM